MELDFLFDDLGLDFIPKILRPFLVFSVFLVPFGVLFTVMFCFDDGEEAKSNEKKKT